MRQFEENVNTVLEGQMNGRRLLNIKLGTETRKEKNHTY